MRSITDCSQGGLGLAKQAFAVGKASANPRQLSGPSLRSRRRGLAKLALRQGPTKWEPEGCVATWASILPEGQLAVGKSLMAS